MGRSRGACVGLAACSRAVRAPSLCSAPTTATLSGAIPPLSTSSESTAIRAEGSPLRRAPARRQQAPSRAHGHGAPRCAAGPRAGSGSGCGDVSERRGKRASAGHARLLRRRPPLSRKRLAVCAQESARVSPETDNDGEGLTRTTNQLVGRVEAGVAPRSLERRVPRQLQLALVCCLAASGQGSERAQGFGLTGLSCRRTEGRQQGAPGRKPLQVRRTFTLHRLELPTVGK